MGSPIVGYLKKWKQRKKKKSHYEQNSLHFCLFPEQHMIEIVPFNPNFCHFYFIITKSIMCGKVTCQWLYQTEYMPTLCPLSASREVSRHCVRWPQTQKPSSIRACCLSPALSLLRQLPRPSPLWCCDLPSPPPPLQPPALPRPKPQLSASLRHRTVNLDW